MTEETKLPSLADMQGDLSCNYDELYHDHPDCYNPEHYNEYLDTLSEEELTELWLETYGD